MQTKTCIDCNSDKSLSEFYTQKGHAFNKMSYCRTCFNKRCVIRWIKRKVEAINLKGGMCENCGLQLKDSHYSVFEFHHRNPIEKDSDWAKLRTMSWPKIQKELDKCALLCANCHRIVHSEGVLLNLDFTEFDNIQQALSLPTAPK